MQWAMRLQAELRMRANMAVLIRVIYSLEFRTRRMENSENEIAWKKDILSLSLENLDTMLHL